MKGRDCPACNTAVGSCGGPESRCWCECHGAEGERARRALDATEVEHAVYRERMAHLGSVLTAVAAMTVLWSTREGLHALMRDAG